MTSADPGRLGQAPPSRCTQQRGFPTQCLNFRMGV